MSIVNVALWALGIALIAIGYLRARDPYRRYMALRAQDENEARYASWRGGRRLEGTTGASVAMQVLRRQAQIWGGVVIAGVVLVFLGILIR